MFARDSNQETVFGVEQLEAFTRKRYMRWVIFLHRLL